MIRYAPSARLSIVLTCLLLLGACARKLTTAHPDAGSALGPGPLLPPSAIGEQFLWRQHVTATWEDRSESFDAVLQMHDGRLVLLGLGPMGSPAFMVALSESGVTVENRTGRRMPFPAEHIIADIQKVFYPWLPPVADGFTGTRSGAYENLAISETYAGGRRLTRAFRRDDASNRGELTVTYEGWRSGLLAPERAELINAWFGYQLTIVTVEQQRLPVSAGVSDEANQ
ncbi:MAG: DUF3261 domain-containing protein [Polyangiales bacterium]